MSNERPPDSSQPAPPMRNNEALILNHVVHLALVFRVEMTGPQLEAYMQEMLRLDQNLSKMVPIEQRDRIWVAVFEKMVDEMRQFPTVSEVKTWLRL